MEDDATFIGYLTSLNESGNRGALADLRRGLSGEPWNEVKMHKYVVPKLTDSMYPWDQKVYYMVAALFASNPNTGGKGDMGETMAHLSLITDSQSVESRFISLLDAHPDDLFDRLRYTVSLLKSKEISVDWYKLCHDLKRWNDPERSTQNRWSRSYWKMKEIKEE